MEGEENLTSMGSGSKPGHEASEWLKNVLDSKFLKRFTFGLSSESSLFAKFGSITSLSAIGLCKASTPIASGLGGTKSVFAGLFKGNNKGQGRG